MVSTRCRTPPILVCESTWLCPVHLEAVRMGCTYCQLSMMVSTSCRASARFHQV